MQIIVPLVLSIVVALIRVLAFDAPAVGAFVSSYVFCGIGLAGLFLASGHWLRGPEVAARIGWPAHSPFQEEVAAANLALGAVGLVAPFAGAGSVQMAALGHAVFYWGCAATHLRDQRRSGNFAEYNSGALVWLSVVVPAALLVGVLVLRFG